MPTDTQRTSLPEASKALTKGLDQLAQEGCVKVFREPGGGTAAPILGAVGPLQFEVLTHRLASEYKVELRLTPLPYKVARWPQGGFDPAAFQYSQASLVVEDRDGRPVVLSENLWHLERAVEQHGFVLAETADPELFER